MAMLRTEPSILLTRFAYTPEGVFGSYLLDGEEFFTCERPWLDNKRSVSCIPIGMYHCDPKWFNRGDYETWELYDVPDRTHILIHKGNTMLDSRGCILVGTDLGSINGLWAVTNSTGAFRTLTDEFTDADEKRLSFSLEIKNINQNDAGVLIRRGQRLE